MGGVARRMGAAVDPADGMFSLGAFLGDEKRLKLFEQRAKKQEQFEKMQLEREKLGLISEKEKLAQAMLDSSPEAQNAFGAMLGQMAGADAASATPLGPRAGGPISTLRVANVVGQQADQAAKADTAERTAFDLNPQQIAERQARRQQTVAAFKKQGVDPGLLASSTDKDLGESGASAVRSIVAQQAASKTSADAHKRRLAEIQAGAQAKAKGDFLDFLIKQGQGGTATTKSDVLPDGTLVTPGSSIEAIGERTVRGPARELTEPQLQKLDSIAGRLARDYVMGHEERATLEQVRAANRARKDSETLRRLTQMPPEYAAFVAAATQDGVAKYISLPDKRKELQPLGYFETARGDKPAQSAVEAEAELVDILARKLLAINKLEDATNRTLVHDVEAVAAEVLELAGVPANRIAELVKATIARAHQIARQEG